MTEEKNLEGLNGWLFLIGFKIVVSPINIVVQFYPLYSELFPQGAWAVLTTPGSEAYNPLWALILIAETGINGGLLLTWLFLAFLFFSRKKVFPKWFIGVLIFMLVFVLVDALVANLVLLNVPLFDPDTSKEFGVSTALVLIWVPYMLKSKRVKATFVN